MDLYVYVILYFYYYSIIKILETISRIKNFEIIILSDISIQANKDFNMRFFFYILDIYL